MIGPVTIESPQGPLLLRPERPDDEAFCFALFCASRPFVVPLPDLMRMQYRARAQSYREHFPGAAAWVVERGTEPVGRLLVERTGAGSRLVDIAVLPHWRGGGIGTALLRWLTAQAERGRPLHLSVAADNAAARRLYEREGFQVVATSPADHEMTWSAP